MPPDTTEFVLTVEGGHVGGERIRVLAISNLSDGKSGEGKLTFR